MWGQPNPDPGGDQPEPQTSREIEDLKGQNEQQELLIAQLKEMLRKEQSTVTQEKVEEYVNTLSKAKAKKSKLKKSESGSTKKSSSNPMDSKKHEKVNLMKQQLEENKAKLAERGMRQKDIEEMVTVLKAQLDDSSQQLINSAPANLSSLEKNLEYSKNSSPEELYNILLVKEKRVADLAEKVQKQNATVLDLQENLKEKDSVIDARTKAITLMTESLSKKGKDTLDALDDTKDQMRKMQEHFVVLESEMKARQMILLNDLKSKNTEISDLEEKNEKLIKEINTFKIERPENVDHELLIKDLNQKLEEKKALIEDYQNKMSDLEKSLELANKPDRENQNEEIEKLKKQLDESNKNMIKVKAQSKSRIKDLNKRLDGFKKMSDANVLIVQLQNEIVKLNEKNAELEEEKGNMQLKMVESIKGSTADDLKELQEKTRENMTELEEKDKVISILESDIISLKSQISDLNDAISGFSQLKNEQVTTEIQSIQVEEELELLQSKNKELHSEIDALKKENVEYIEKIREFAKEKSELTTKLDNYIQENMELIDKLEKLSAEKVSSAESIEIVEGLTQQEKLELAAYQKNMDANLDDPIKQQEEEPPVELNESVLQLTEETAELLKKIEMFNMERKEVMTKLECLREENNQLSLKLNEVENNRDILAETYEQVQTEKDELVKENEKLTKRINDLENQNSPREASEDNEASLKLEQLQKDLERSIEENVKLTASLKEYDAITREKVNLESELARSKERIDDLLSTLNEHRLKITNYELIIEENKSELIDSSNKINQLQSLLIERENEIEELNTLMNDLNTVVTNLQQDNSKTDIFEDMEKQMEEMKQSLNKQAEDFNEELAFVKTAGELEIEKKNLEISKLSKEIAFKDEIIKEKDQSVNAAIEEMKQKYLVLQKQLNANSGTLEKQLEEVSAKNKEQLEKMKKIAANLKKKNRDYQELEEKYVGEKEKWETEINKKETDLQELSSNVSILEQRNVDLQNMLLESKQKHEKTTEVSLQQELSTSLHEEFDNLHGSKESINEDKIKEMQLIMETTEGELHHYKERSQMLEEDLAVLLEEKEKLLHKISKLEEKLNLLTMNFEEKSMLEEEMSSKLQEVSAKDETLTRRFDELSKENKQLTDKTREQEELILKLKIKIKKGQEKINQMKNLQAALDEKEEANTVLKRQMAHLEAVQKQTQIEYEEKQRQNQIDYEKIETDYQLQLEGLVKNRNDVTFECEKLQEEVKLLKEREEELLAELNEFNQKLSEAEDRYANEIASLTESLNETSAKWSSSVQTIEILQKQLDNLQIQTVHDAAKTTIADVILDAKEKVDNNYSSVDATEEFFQQNFPTLEWGNEVNPPPQGSDVTKEGLENKIRALEILLYNVDQEKKEVVQECSDMLNELTRLIYEKVNLTVGPSDQPVEEKAGLSQMESQILFSDDIEQLNDPIRLQELEFERSEASLGQQNHPVVEHVGPPAKAYLTYQAGENEEAGLSQIESQILFSDDIEQLNDPIRLQELEFERCNASLGQQNHPVVEQLVQPTKAYLTYQVGEAIGENDDGWGWGPEEARLEEEHQYRTENTPQVQALKAEVQQLEEKLQTLQNERENHLEEVKQLQLKSGKLVKKCKELKSKNDQLLAKIRSDSNDLDTAIQEELKTQIEQLETKIKETSSELDKEKQDKSKLLRKVDSLTSANEKMLETSQIKDSEIYRWKRKCEEIQEKLDHLDWDNDETKLSRKQAEESTESVPEDIEELKKLVEDLTVDNEELQALLNDQNQQQKQLQRSQSVSNEERIKNLEILEKKDVIVEELNKKIASLESLQDLDNLRKEIGVKDVLISELEGQMKLLKETYIEGQKAIEEKERLKNELEEVRSNDKLVKDLEKQLVEKTALAEQLEYSNNSLFQEISGLRDELANLQNQLEFHDAKRESQALEDCNPLIQELTNFKAASIKDLLDLLNEEQINLERTRQQLVEKTTLAEQLGHSNDSFYREISELRQELESLKDQMGIQNLQKGKLELLEDYNPLILEATHSRATSIKGLLDLLNEERVKVEQAQALLKAHDQKFENWRQQYNDLQNATSKNILELQTSLESEKLKNDQLQIENVNKLKEVTEELEAERTKFSNLQPSSNSGDQLSERDLNEELKKTIDGLQVKNGELETEIKQLNESLYSKQQELLEMENKLVETISGLEDKWIAQVDERGNQVADSWKYHLSIVESDFAALQEKLRNEINELEEKYNALVNENNELRKNVDADIKNEVNRISALQQQINDRQQALNEMGQVLVTERMEKEALAQRVAEMDKIQQHLSDKEVELASLKALAETTRQQFDEKREVVEEIVKILERNTSYPLSCEKQDILNEIQRQLSQLADKHREVDSLNSEVQHLVDQVKNFTAALQEKDNEIIKLKEGYDKEFSNKTDNLNSQLQHLVDQVKYFTGALQEKEDEVIRLKEQYENEFSNKTENIAGLNESIEQLQDQARLVGQKEEEIVRLEKIIEENKIQLSFAQQESQNLQQLYDQSNMAVESYKQKLEEFRQTQISLQNSVEEKNRQNEYLIEQIQSLNQQLQISTDNKEKQQIENELIQTKEAYLVLQQSLSDCQQQLFNLTQDLATKSHDFETVGQQLAFSQQNVDVLSEEIQKLNQLLQSKERDYGASLENIEKTRYKELEYYYEEILSAKEMDIQTLKTQLAESVRYSGDLETKLKQLEAQITTLSAVKTELDSKISEQTSLIDEENKQMTEMRSIIEGQVVKIEELKKELFEKSNDYDSLIAEMDISRTAITQQPTASEPRVTRETVKPEERQAVPEDDLSEPVNRAELNLALYMLHQRDVRCEELTVELTQLLEERDALQLRLSNAIREKEEIKRNMKDPPNVASMLASTSSGEATQKASGTSEMFHGASGTALPIELSETLIDGQDLATKLSELRTVGYKKDKTFVDEQEQRRMQQISIMQQHIREASRLPPEAAAKLVDASYTLSRDIQSPSKVLLNWLWGRSTPRVNDT